jgi:hypothetical protein
MRGSSSCYGACCSLDSFASVAFLQVSDDALLYAAPPYLEYAECFFGKAY